HGIFIENRLTRLAASGKAAVRVVAPVAYVPDFSMLPEAYRRLRRAPQRETRAGLEIDHPRYVLPPKIGMVPAPLSLYLAARRRLAAIRAAGYDFDLIDAHYFYPDGVAAVLLGRHFDRPVTITARGSDINLLAQYRLPRQMIRWAAMQASGLI